jgi:Spx/MgsR family transcriptional regulator
MNNINPITVYGIPNCDTVKKASAYLAEKKIDYIFHDFKKQGVPAALMGIGLASIGWEKLLNRKGTTWRQLDASVQASVTDSESAKAVMIANPSTIKRPVIQWTPVRVTVGFNLDEWASMMTLL